MAAVSTGGDQDQPVAVRPGERHLRPGGRQVQAHPIQGLQAHPPPSGILNCPSHRHFCIVHSRKQGGTELTTLSMHYLTYFNGLNSAIYLTPSFLRIFFISKIYLQKRRLC
jgi:hypothetical protein